ncbi:MAG: hypothetical protein IJS10_01720 [Alphaproteobacteria bacterium]|nr:hypothetical protein [Alphaproteobacteria bacterium]
MTETRDLLAYRKFSYRIKRKFKINILCIDGNLTYQKIKLSNKHVISKSKTCLVGNTNSVIRRRLARFHRRTSCYSQAMDMIFASLLLLFNEELLYSIIG